ncbi:hypothetical protein [Edaphobacter modestus]|uniref:Uncharacterized protein n=1 Tax=Edaphobacter modestus TaxID=388466 RepID=A0A4Q7YMY9_9BACT|nr:hypothetical protein [Edaphobacter modestus]RZU38957.1 hypothetical protein BDD14_0272 [Edaphobacter modestus]
MERSFIPWRSTSKRILRGFGANLPQLTFNNQGPGVTAADYGNGQVTAVVPDAWEGAFGLSISPEATMDVRVRCICRLDKSSMS